MATVTSMVAAGCDNRVDVRVVPKRASLGSGLVASIDGFGISAGDVTATQVQSELSTDQALEALFQSYLIGQWAMSGGLELGRRKYIERALLARYLLEGVDARVWETGEPTDAEIAEELRRRWYELDRPVAYKVSHVVVKTEQTNDTLAEEVAKRIAVAVSGIREGAAFIERARAVPSLGLNVVAEALPPITADGRGFQTDASGNPIADAGQFDQVFSEAASRLQTPGEQSSLVRTRFGIHIIFLEAKIAGYTIPSERRRVELRSDIHRRRAQQLVRSWIEQRGKTSVPQTERSAIEWMTHVKVAQ